MPTLQHPGVYVNEVLGRLTTDTPFTASALGAFVGAASRGPTTPTTINSWADFNTLFGGFGYGTYLADAVFAYFTNGGGTALVCRVPASDAVSALRVFNDQSAVSTMTVTAANSGAWANTIFLEIIPKVVGITATLTGRFDLNVRYGSSTAAVVERYSDLSMISTDNRYFVRAINGSSAYVTVADNSSVSVAPANTPLAGTFALATGANGVAALVSADWTAAQNKFLPISQPLAMNFTGLFDTTILSTLLSAAEATTSVFVVVDGPSGQTASTAISNAASLTATAFGAAWAPWIKINDPSVAVPGVTKLIPPGGSVVGQIISTDAGIGPFQTPAGITNRLPNAIGLETAWQDADLDLLNSSVPPVNAIRSLPGYGICLFGSRTLKSGYPDKYINIRRSLIYLEKSLDNLTKFAVFQNNDETLWNRIRVRIGIFLNAYWALGGLVGDTADNAYYVICDATNNSVQSIANGVVNIQVGVAPQYPADFVIINLTQYQGGVSTTS